MTEQHPVAEVGKFLVFLVSALIGLAMVSVLVGQSAKTTEVVKAFSEAYSRILGAILQPMSSNTGGFRQ